MTEAQKVTLEFTVDELNVVLAGLGELPAKASLALIDRIRAQATEQLRAAAASAGDEVVQ
jgi:hypothetical protein